MINVSVNELPRLSLRTHSHCFANGGFSVSRLPETCTIYKDNVLIPVSKQHTALSLWHYYSPRHLSVTLLIRTKGVSVCQGLLANSSLKQPHHSQ